MAKGIIEIHIKANTAIGEMDVSGNTMGAQPEELTEVFAAILGGVLKANGLANDFKRVAVLTKLFGQNLYVYSTELEKTERE